MQTFLYQKFQPKRRKSIASKLRTPRDLSILLNDPRAGHCLYLSFQDPIHDEFGRGAPGPDTGRHDYVRIQNGKPHLAFRRLRTMRT